MISKGPQDIRTSVSISYSDLPRHGILPEPHVLLSAPLRHVWLQLHQLRDFSFTTLDIGVQGQSSLLGESSERLDHLAQKKLSSTGKSISMSCSSCILEAAFVTQPINARTS